MNRLLFLGTGASLGIPVVGCQCPVCTSAEPRNKRLRSSVLVTVDGKQLLIDAGPDFRTQALQYDIRHLDGLIVTHEHNDHVAGLDDVRALYLTSKKPTPCLLSRETYDVLKYRYAYIFAREKAMQSSAQLVSKFDITLLPAKEGIINFQGIDIGYVTYEQSGVMVNGFRFGDLAYISDIKKYEETIFDQLRGVKILVVSALRHEVSPLHFSVEDAITFARRVGAQQTWLMHIDHNIEYTSSNRTLPAGVQLAYDGLEIQF
jgi:phosphoribosyl 1,2-cyclic phosphate phosphodiesterase